MFKLPSTDQVRHLGEELGFDVTADYANSFINYIRPFADGFRLLAALPDDVPAIKHPRGAYYRPEGDENKYGAWIVEDPHQGRAERPACRQESRDQRHLRDRRRSAHQRSIGAGGFCTGIRRNRRHAAPRCRRGDRRQIGLRIFFLLRRRRHQHVRTRFTIRAHGATRPAALRPAPAHLVAAGEVDMATGGDQAGSIRIPASLSGVVGIKPTWGLVPYTGIMGMDPTIDHAGPLTATAAENALVP